MSLINCPECGKEISDKTDKCPNCGYPISQMVNNTSTQHQNTGIFIINGVQVDMYKLMSEYPDRKKAIKKVKKITKADTESSEKAVDDFLNNLETSGVYVNGTSKKHSTLSIISFVLSLFACFFIIGLILSIIDLAGNDRTKKHSLSKASIILFVLWCLIAATNLEKYIGTSNQKQTFTVGETAELNDVQITLSDYKESTGNEYNKPLNGNVFVIAKFEIENNTDEDLAISSMLSFDAYADGYSLPYSLSALTEKERSQLDGTISSGKKMKGWIGWEVPQDYESIEIHFTDNVWGDDKIKFLIDR